MRWLAQRRRITCVLLFVLAFAIYAVVSGDRLRRQSPDPHFVLQADAWLHGKLSIDPPWKGDDPAKVETVLLKDGRELRGRYLKTRGWTVGSSWFLQHIEHPEAATGRLPSTRFFQSTKGEVIAEADVQRSLKTTNYVSFPPAPAILMVPQTIVHGRIANDVVPTIFVAALIFPLIFLVLGRLREAGHSDRSDQDNLWLSAQLSFGTVLFFVAVAGRVWFTAHVVGVFLALAYVYFAIDARRPVLAGLMLGLATLCRTPMAFMFPFFAIEACRVAGGANWREWFKQWRAILKLWLPFAAPIVLIAVVAGVLNVLRFDSASEFGHSYLAVRQQAMIEEYGLFDYEYLRRNLSVALTLLPSFSKSAPYVHISGHGMALWITTPLFLSLLWPRRRELAHKALWATVALIAIPILLYQNSGWIQFGYRFSLDFTVFLVLLLAVGGRPLSRFAKALIVLSILINLFGAWTFGRYHQFYDGGSYDVVIPNHPR